MSESVIHIYRGPSMEPPEPIEPLTQRSAAHCDFCRKRRVQILVIRMPVMDPETMREGQMMAAAMCGPELYWQCPCGELMYSSYEVEW